jgi:hypothetical protein
MAEDRAQQKTIDAVRELMGAGFAAFNEAKKKAAELELAEKLGVLPLEIADAEDIVTAKILRLGEVVKPVAILADEILTAWEKFDDERCRALLQQLAVQLLASGYPPTSKSLVRYWFASIHSAVSTFTQSQRGPDR